jgi:hypothetical protein
MPHRYRSGLLEMPSSHTLPFKERHRRLQEARRSANQAARRPSKDRSKAEGLGSTACPLGAVCGQLRKRYVDSPTR